MEWDPKKNPGKAPIGGKPKRQNQQAQAKAQTQAMKKAEAESSSQTTNELTFQEIFGLDTILLDWSLKVGKIVGSVLDQKDKEICWAICFARLLQALYNINLPSNQHIEFSVNDLLGYIKPKEKENFAIANLKKAFKHISDVGMLKMPIKGPGTAGDKGKRVKENFELYEDVDARFVQERLNRYPVALRLEPDMTFSSARGKEIYYLPKKKIITPETRLHCLLLIGYGVTKEGEFYYIGQNSWGVGWGCLGYVRIAIKEKCDIICLKE